MQQTPPHPPMPSASSAPSLPPFDANRRWYDEFRQQVEQNWGFVMQLVYEKRTAVELQSALADVLDETAGGNFLSDATRARVAPLVAQTHPDVLSTQWMQDLIRRYEQEQGVGR